MSVLDPMLFGWLVISVAGSIVCAIAVTWWSLGIVAQWWERLPVGTRSLLAGAHCWFLHPFAVARGWHHLYGWSWRTCPSTGVRTGLLDPRLWVAFIVHDWGYWGSPNMDGPEGERHPGAGARMRWHEFMALHSRHRAKAAGAQPSLLCHADKAATAFTPAWIAVPLSRLSGEILEYRSRETRPANSKGWTEADDAQGSDWDWYRRVREWCLKYAEEHRDGKADTWTVNEAEPQPPPTLASVAANMDRLRGVEVALVRQHEPPPFQGKASSYVCPPSHRVVERGPSQGTYKDRSVPSWILCGDGKVWHFHRTVGEELDLRHLAPDECVIFPGLIYRHRSEAQVEGRRGGAA